MADNMAGGARLGEHAQNMTDEAREAAQDMGSQVSDAANKYAQQAKDYAAQAKDYAQQGYQYAADKSKQVKDSTEGYITENPWYAVGIALGVGVLLGLLLRGGND